MNKPLSEYPRPQLKRDSYICLNGYWEYAIRTTEAIPDVFDGQILVPYSPEVEKSGVNKVIGPNDYLFYRLKYEIPKEFINDKVILHFGAVDQIAELFINGKFALKHVGGFLPFSCDIKPYLEDNKLEIILRVQDTTNSSYHSSGKQALNPGGIWYKPQSGIYMPVWMESVKDGFIEKIKITPDIDKKVVNLRFISSEKTAKLDLNGRILEVKANFDNIVEIPDMKLWSPENPYLYEFKLSNSVDEISSYFAMRKISLVKNEKGMKVIALNNEPYFMKGVLDQGYYKGGLYTPESYQDYIADLGLVKSLGFNTIRKHIKIEMPRWYYECDRMGILVWQDFINGGGKYKPSIVLKPLVTGKHKKDNRYAAFGRNDVEGRMEAKQEFRDIISYLYNTPSIVLWTIFNEGWGQFDAKDIYYGLRDMDKTRLFDHASGWHDQGVSDVKSLHVYFKKVKMPSASKAKNRAVCVTEFGGLVLPIADHMRKGKQTYKAYKTVDKWLDAYEKMINRDILGNIRKGLSASIYTQLSDVEDELNGFVTFDRQVVKCSVEKIKAINEKIKFE